jgi:hypothetical protein
MAIAILAGIVNFLPHPNPPLTNYQLPITHYPLPFDDNLNVTLVKLAL